MIEKEMSLLGAGVVTDAYADVSALAREVGAAVRAEVLEESAVGMHDALPGLAIRALHQAISMAGASAGESMGLIVVTQWGMIDATVNYLESMLADGGRYASPRHFTRSVYSAATSVVAIHFGIRGPCLSLAFDAREDFVAGALGQAWRMLKAGRCERVAVIWAEQGSELAADLAGRAVRLLGRREHERYAAGVGFGATAVVMGMEGGMGRVRVGGSELIRVRGKAYPMDRAVGWLAGMLTGPPPLSMAHVRGGEQEALESTAVDHGRDAHATA